MRRRIQAMARQAGIDIELEVQSSAEYYGGGADYYATTPWLNRPATLTEYGARGVPNLYLTAAYMTDGIWNASHYKNAEFDSAAKQYLEAPTLAAEAEGDEEDGRPPACATRRSSPTTSSRSSPPGRPGSRTTGPKPSRTCAWPRPS